MDLNQAYNNVAAVGNFPQIMQGFRQRSAETYARHAWQRDVPYGNAMRERFDWYAQANAGRRRCCSFMAVTGRPRTRTTTPLSPRA
jgi:hypothetical protein